METLKKPIWRVPLVLGGTGLVCRIIGYILSFLWVRIQIAQGPGPEGSYVLTTGHLSAIMAVISFVLFWLAADPWADPAGDLPLRLHHGAGLRRAAGLGAAQPGPGRILPLGLPVLCPGGGNAVGQSAAGLRYRDGVPDHSQPLCTVPLPGVWKAERLVLRRSCSLARTSCRLAHTLD